MNIRSLIALSLPALAVAALSGCNKEAEAPAPAPAEAAATVPASIYLAAAPEGAQDIAPVKAVAKVGDEVVVRGRIGGRVEPFVSGRAVFTLTDATLPSCADMGEDHCPTPWDYCCEDRENLVASTATVRIVGPDGQPLKADLNGPHGVRPMAEVFVVGKVAEADGQGNLVIDATGLYANQG